MLVSREVILAKLETTYNEDAMPDAAADAILVENPAWSNAGLRMNERTPVKATMGKAQSYYGGHLRSVTFDVELKGSGTAGTAPEMGPLLQACGMLETVDVSVPGSEFVAYAPISSNHKSLTIYYYQDGLLRKMTGCRGNVSFNLETGMVGKASFTFTGHDGGTSDTALVSPTYDSTVAPGLVSVPFSFGSYPAAVSKLSFDMSNQVQTPSVISAPDGFGDVVITSRDVNGSFDPEATLKATQDWETMLMDGTQSALDTGLIGDTAGNRYQVQMPAAYMRDMSPGDKSGVRVYEVPFGAVENAGDDEVSITFS